MVYEGLANFAYQDLLRFAMSSTSLQNHFNQAPVYHKRANFSKLFVLNVLRGNALKAFFLYSIFVAYHNKTPYLTEL